MKYLSRLMTCLVTLLIASPGQGAEAPKVVASIKPIHSLVSAVMAGVAEPGLLIDGEASPHGTSLRPSQARALRHADLIFWVGPDLEQVLEKPIAALSDEARVFALEETPGLTLFGFRGAKEDHEEAAHEEHGHDEHGHDDHGHGETDLHIWLDPMNAQALAHHVADILSAADPAHGATYKSNAARLAKQLEALGAELAATLKPIQARPFMVFHDAYRYFEERYGLQMVGSMTISPHSPPGARHVMEVRDKLKALGNTCLFSEPQFEPRLVHRIIKGTKALTGALDPLGADIEAGPDHYFKLLRGLADSFRRCLDRAADGSALR
ncbi:zinc ABC transporter substrate-binding protein [Magnetospira sp. QH-2]|uniref:zinc ABC transporter substrate-binding protein n=1 Tax=Magnetospira sp. (strain QH-2) TaxID=1288970 RepID=UPI0003E80F4C|nr:zinc ABC transporter substrate-binding protein [Magnetospira sp. QH-2]CCQ74553.1 High-affinity zinc uptake system protein znuA [Magnetospira sp. QH-2]